jgi:hypothetical protein
MAHEVEDLRLHRHIERGRGVVGDKQLLSIGQGRLGYFQFGSEYYEMVLTNILPPGFGDANVATKHKQSNRRD